MLNMVFGNLFAAFFYMYVDTDTENKIGIISAPNFYLFLIFFNRCNHWYCWFLLPQKSAQSHR